MRFIENKTVNTLNGLSDESLQILEEKRLGILKRENGTFIIIKECGLGSGIDKNFKSLAELDAFVKRNFK